jgi:hypothetical protein
MATTLSIYDFDDTLYCSPKAPTDASPNWYYHAKSLGNITEPGFDWRWNLSLLAEARRESFDPTTAVMLLTARPNHGPMRTALEAALNRTDVVWDAIVLKPVIFAGSDAAYKAVVVARWLHQHPETQKIIVRDDRPENLEAIAQIPAVQARRYVPVLI